MISLVIGVTGFFVIANIQVLRAGAGKTFATIESIPHHRVGIVLGCSPTIGSYKNPFFEGRIDAATRLYKSGKVDRLLVTGDNGRAGYDEPTAMELALVSRGIPTEYIVKDFAGFHTLDSMVRANKVFGLTDATIITDDFHVPRTLYIAQRAGISADAYPSAASKNINAKSVEFREIVARAGAVIDQEVLHSSPKFLGKPVAIP